MKFIGRIILSTWLFGVAVTAALSGEHVYRNADEINRGNLYEKVRHVDFSDYAYPSNVMDLLRSLKNIETIVVGGPRYTDSHLKQLSAIGTLRLLVLDSTDVSTAAIDRARAMRPDLSILSSQRLAIKQLSALAPEVIVDSQVATPAGAEATRRILGDEHFRIAVSFDLGHLPDDERGPWEPLLSEELAPLRMLPTLTKLDLTYARVNDGTMYYLRDLNRVKSLRLPMKDVTATGMSLLKGMKDLENFTGALDDSTIGQLSRFSNLKSLLLDASGSALTDEGLSHLGKLRKLTIVDLRRTSVRGKGLRHLARLPSLQSLNLDETAVDDLSHVASCSALKSLYLSKTRIGDDALAYVAKCTNLETLWLVNTRVTDAGIAHLAGHPNLCDLNIEGTGVTEECLRHLKDLPRLQHVHLSRTQVPRRAAEQELPNIEHVFGTASLDGR